MKSFQNFGINIVEAERRAYGNPTGYGPGGEPMYTKRPGPREKGRPAQPQKSPPTVASVKSDIAARNAFNAARSGGLEARSVPDFVTQRRQERANRLLGPSPWDQARGSGEKSFERGLRRLTPPTGPSPGHQERALRDFINQSSRELGTSTDRIIASMMSGKSAVPFTSPVPAAPDPWKPSQTATTPPKPEPVSQAQVSQQAAKYRKAQTAQRVTTAMGGTPSSVSFSTPTPSKTPGSKASQVIDVELVEPKKSPELKLGSQPGGQMEPSGAQRTPVRGVTAGLGPVRNVVEPVDVRVIEPPKAPTVSSTPVKATSVPKPKTVAPTVSLSLTRTPAPAVAKGAALSVTKPKVKQAVSTKNLGKVVSDVLKTERKAKEAVKAASAAKTAKAIGRIGTLGTIAASGIEAKGEYDKARREGASRNRAFGAGVARALGGLGGSAIGAVGGGAIAGLPGAFIGGTAGYTGGANLASSAYKAITGDNKQKLTTQRVLTNIRKAVPQEIRREIPAGARKAFRDLVTQTGRVYGNWRRSQEQ